MVVYHVKPGSEKELAAILAKLWKTYKDERMVRSEPHVCVQAHEDAQHEYFIEIFTWAGCFAMEHPPESVMDLWQQAGSLCASRNGRLAVEYHSPKMLEPKIPELAE